MSIAEAARLILEGGLVAFPTETVYGLGGDATNERAVAAIFEAKGRPQFNPLISHVLGPDEAKRLVRWNDTADKLAARFWPGPLTLVLPRAKDSPIALLATAGLDTVAVRAPAHPLAQALIRAVGRPLAAPSANRSGAVSPTRAEHVAESLGDRVKMVLDGGPCDGRTRIDGARPHDRCSHTAASRRRHARGDRGGDRPHRAQRCHSLRRVRAQIAGPAREPLRPGAAGAARRDDRRAAKRACSRSGPMCRRAPSSPSISAPAATLPRRRPTCSPCCARSISPASAASRSCPFRKRDWALRSTTACAARPRMTARAGDGRLAAKERKRCPIPPFPLFRPCR